MAGIGNSQQPARARRTNRGGRGNGGACEQRHANHQRAVQGDVGVRVGDSREDGAILE